MRFVRPAALCALLTTAAMTVPAIAGAPTAADKQAAGVALVTLSQLNVFVKANLTNGGGEIEGKTWVGGNLNGGNGFNIGFGASNGQSTVASTFATVTVGGNQNAQVQIKNQVGGSYGAYVVGSSNGIEVQENNGTVNVGGSVSGKISVSTGTALRIAGSYNDQNGLSLGGSNNVWIGGNSTRIQGGSNNTIRVGGNLKSADITSGSTAQIGGSLGANGDNSSTNGDVTVLGNISNLNMNANNLTVKAGGSVNGQSGISTGSNLYAGGSISVQNNNGGPGAIHANCGANYANCAGVAAPVSPGAPTVASVAGDTQTMFDNFAALSNSLTYLAQAGHTGTLISGSQGFTFKSTATSGYTVFNVDQSIFSKNEFAYDFANTSTPIIINVKSTNSACTTNLTCSYSMASNFTGNASQYNKNVIWNFADASSVVLTRQFQGTVLAYLADLQANVIEGSVVAKNFNQTNEVHLGTYGNNGNNGNNGLLTGVIPEPANWALMIGGFGLVGGVVRRRRRGFAVAA
ncbi:hypothetical protein SPAN111604_10035 [Sphingomonas antarctica]|uniref:collagen-binding domain-containing protein n=1 Tax=Sphingomonas antarctica TaxID=2040274 RepID=UPI0039EB0F8F